MFNRLTAASCCSLAGSQQSHVIIISTHVFAARGSTTQHSHLCAMRSQFVPARPPAGGLTDQIVWSNPLSGCESDYLFQVRLGSRLKSVHLCSGRRRQVRGVRAVVSSGQAIKNWHNWKVTLRGKYSRPFIAADTLTCRSRKGTGVSDDDDSVPALEMCQNTVPSKSTGNGKNQLLRLCCSLKDILGLRSKDETSGLLCHLIYVKTCHSIASDIAAASSD